MKKKLKKNTEWLIAKKLIPGGNMLISKRSEFILPDYWPSYYYKAKDCYVWDLKKNKYLDMFFSPGTNILGYSNQYVEKKVINSLKKSNMSSLNAYEEVLLAKKLISLHKWADMVKFARTGGEANAVSIRIARAAAESKTNIAFCGYHGWHDWYMSSALNKKENLRNHLIEGIDNSGLPQKLKNTAFPFEYNNFDNLKKLVKEKNIGIIKMEVVRNVEPKNDFLIKVRKLCDQKKIILIFDECTSGFRNNIGGIHYKYKINPDILLLGKALGNGYPITAIMGKKKIMKNASKTFISSTFWTERLGYTAALSTIQFMKNNNVIDHINKNGSYIKKRWKEIADSYSLKINISGIDALPSFSFDLDYNKEAITLFTQEMLKNNILASNVIYLSYAHKKKHLKKYLSVVQKIFEKISKLKNKSKISNLLIGKARQSHLRRLN